MMDDLTVYIIRYYGHLMSDTEQQANRNLHIARKMAYESNLKIREWLRRGVSDAPEVQALLSDGEEAFYLRVRERILAERADQVQLNHCPRCNTLARTPRARQCRKCLFRWESPLIPSSQE